MSRTPARSVASASGQNSLDPGMPWSSTTGRPSGGPHSEYARRRPSPKVTTRSTFGLADGLAIASTAPKVKFPEATHPAHGAPLRSDACSPAWSLIIHGCGIARRNGATSAVAVMSLSVRRPRLNGAPIRALFGVPARPLSHDDGVWRRDAWRCGLIRSWPT